MINNLKTYFVFLLIAYHTVQGQVLVSTESELQSAISSATAGSNIVLKNGVWNNIRIDIDKTGTATNPITISAETPGEVYLEGNSRVNLGGEYIVFSGVVFRNPSNMEAKDSDDLYSVIEFRSSSKTVCNHCTVSNIKIDAYNGSTSQELMTFKWILLYGQYNEVSRSSFIGKHGVGSIINDNRNDVNENYHKIHHNYFADRTFVGTHVDDYNDQDAIRIGTSSTSLSDSYSEVYNNFFHNFFGEIEIISNKSGYNKYYNNTFRNYSGSLTLRHGDNCEVYNNYFFAEQNLFSGAIRVIGENHKVYNNYIQDVNSSKSTAAGGGTSSNLGGISIMKGRSTSVDGNDLSGYYTVKNALVTNNTFVNCDYGIRVGGGGNTTAPVGLEIANNIFLMASSSDRAIEERIAAPDGTSYIYKGNIRQSGTWTLNGNVSDNTIVASNLLTSSSDFYRLSATSPAIDQGVGSYDFLSKDVTDADRPATPFDAGAEEYGSDGENLPYTQSDVGVSVGFLSSDSPNTDGGEDPDNGNTGGQSETQDDFLLISGIMFSPGGADVPREFIEVMGVAGYEIPNNTYLVCIEGDHDRQGRVKMFFDLSGKTLGANGFFAFQQPDNSYLNAGGTIQIASGTSTDGWSMMDEYSGSGSSGIYQMESASISMLLVETQTALDLSIDIDSDNDGVMDIAGWNILDGVAVTDDDFENSSAYEYSYAPITFGETDESTVKRPDGSTYVAMSLSTNVGYVGRIGRSKGYTENDWVAAAVNSADPVASGDYKFSSSKVSTEAYFSSETQYIAGPNFTLTYKNNTFSASDSKGGSEPTNEFYALEFQENYTSSDNIICHSLLIDSDVTLTIAKGHTLTVNNDVTIHGQLIIESGASLITYGGKNFEGKANIKRVTSFDDGRYSFVGIPIENNDDTYSGSDLGRHVYRYDQSVDYGSNEGLNRWIAASDDILVSGVGYTQANQQNLEFSGVPNTGEVSISYEAGATNDANSGWLLLSNPYTAAISANDFLADNTANLEVASVYIWDDGGSNDERGSNADYLVYNTLGTTSTSSGKTFDGNIGSMQGFFVKAAGNMKFTESMRIEGNNNDSNFFMKAPISTSAKLQLELKGENNSADIIIGLNDDATTGIDKAYDAPKFGGSDDFRFYSWIGEDKYVIQGLPKADNTRALLGFDIASDQSITLQATDISGLDAGMTFYLHDREDDTQYDLSKESINSFDASQGNDQKRFEVVYAPFAVQEVLNVDTQELSNEYPRYKLENGKLTVELHHNSDAAEVIVYDLTGKVLYQKKHSSFRDHSFSIPTLSDGLSILKIVTPRGVFIKKVLLGI